MKDVKEVLENTKAEALRSIDNPESTIDTKKAWYYCHCGEIEMCFFLELITDKDFAELIEEWSNHRPQ